MRVLKAVGNTVTDPTFAMLTLVNAMMGDFVFGTVNEADPAAIDWLLENVTPYGLVAIATLVPMLLSLFKASLNVTQTSLMSYHPSIMEEAIDAQDQARGKNAVIVEAGGEVQDEFSKADLGLRATQMRAMRYCQFTAAYVFVIGGAVASILVHHFANQNPGSTKLAEADKYLHFVNNNAGTVGKALLGGLLGTIPGAIANRVQHNRSRQQFVRV